MSLRFEGYFAVGLLHARPCARPYPRVRHRRPRLRSVRLPRRPERVSDRLDVGTPLRPETLHRAGSPGTLVKIDIEGGELELPVDLVRRPSAT
jgi:hypothetical protein